MITENNYPNRLWNRNFGLLCFNNLFLRTAFGFLQAALPLFIVNYLHTTKSVVGVAMMASSLGGVVMRPVAGAIIDKYGRKRFFLLSIIAYGLLFCSYNLANSVAALVIINFMYGMAWGSACTTSGVVLVDVIPPKQRGSGLGYHGIAGSVAALYAPALGLGIAERAGYSAMFLVAFAICLAGLAMALFVKYPAYQPKKDHFKFKNLFEISSIPASVNFLITIITTGGLTAFIAIYARERGGYNIGAFFTISAVGGIISRWVAGLIFNKRGPREILLTGLLMPIAGFLLLAYVKDAWGFYTASALFGMCSGILYLSFQTMVNNLVATQRRGAANATLFTIINLGLGKLITGFLADSIGFDYTFLLYAGVNVLSIVFFMTITLKHYKNNISKVNNIN